MASADFQVGDRDGTRTIPRRAPARGFAISSAVTIVAALGVPLDADFVDVASLTPSAVRP